MCLEKIITKHATRLLCSGLLSIVKILWPAPSNVPTIYATVPSTEYLAKSAHSWEFMNDSQPTHCVRSSPWVYYSAYSVVGGFSAHKCCVSAEVTVLFSDKFAEHETRLLYSGLLPSNQAVAANSWRSRKTKMLMIPLSN